MNPTTTTKSYCNKCVGMRNHDILHEEKSSWDEEVHDGVFIGGSDTYEMVRCRGCEHISVRHQSVFSENIGPNGDPLVDTQYFPPAIFRAKPRWYADAWKVFGVFRQNLVIKLLDEIYVALQNDLRSLAAMGIRALIEHVMIEKVGDQNSFAGNLKEFCNSGYISKLQLDALNPLIEAGHAAMHRGYSPSPEELALLMDIIESVIESIYFNEHRAKKIQEKVPAKKERILKRVDKSKKVEA
jgi:hypothetical protein